MARYGWFCQWPFLCQISRLFQAFPNEPGSFLKDISIKKRYLGVCHCCPSAEWKGCWTPVRFLRQILFLQGKGKQFSDFFFWWGTIFVLNFCKIFSSLGEVPLCISRKKMSGQLGQSAEFVQLYWALENVSFCSYSTNAQSY